MNIKIFEKKKNIISIIGSMAFCSFLAFFVCILMFSTPIMINILINYVKNPDKRWEDGLKLLIIILVLKLVYSFFSTHQSFYFVICSLYNF